MGTVYMSYNSFALTKVGNMRITYDRRGRSSIFQVLLMLQTAVIITQTAGIILEEMELMATETTVITMILTKMMKIFTTTEKMGQKQKWKLMMPKKSKERK